MTRIRWQPVVDHARQLMAGYDTGVTLRQLFYRLVADGTLPNTQTTYKRLSDQTAQARRAGRFPEFVDTTRQIHRPLQFTDAAHAREWVTSRRSDRRTGRLGGRGGRER